MTPRDRRAAEYGGAPVALSSEMALANREGLPASAMFLHDLFADRPWNEHPNYAGLAEFWLGVHQAIRDEAAGLRELLVDFREDGTDLPRFARGLAGQLRQYLGHLQFHHEIEDHKYFPKFRALDPRLVSWFDLLEADHEVIHAQLEMVAESGGALLRSLQSGSGDLQRSADAHGDAAERLSRLIDRHLADEEDLLIPAILRFGERSVS